MQTVSRDQATRWLRDTTLQRPIRQKVVARYASDMAHGYWEPVMAGPIILDQDTGAVLDGQHRLKAYLSAPDDFELVSEIRYASSESIQVVDTGIPRSLRDALMFRGHSEKDAKTMQAFYNNALFWALGQPGGGRISRTQQVQWLDSNPHTPKACQVARHLEGVAARSTALMRVPIGVSATMWDIAEYAEGGAEVIAFTRRLVLGELENRAGRRLVKLHQDARNPRTKTSVHPRQMGWLIVRVYLAWLEDEDLDKLYARRTAPSMLPGWSEWMDRNWPA